MMHERSIRGGMLLVVAGILVAARASDGDDWTRWRGPEGNGISKETTWKPEAVSAGKVKWKVELGKGHSSVSVTGKCVYTMGNRDGKDIVYCLHEETGKEIWKHAYDCAPGNYPGPRSTPVVDAGRVYTLSRNGDAFCLDAKTGRQIWKADILKAFGGKNITWGLASSPLVVGQVVVYNACSHGVMLSKANGQKVWASPGGKCGYATPVLFKLKGRDCLAVFSAKEVAVVDFKSGKKLAAHPWETKYDVNAADPACFADKLYISSAYNRGGTLLDLSGGALKPLWENKNLKSHFCGPVYHDGHLYGVDGNTGGGKLVCLDVRKGDAKWSQGGAFENMTVAAGKIIAIDKSGTLRIAALDPSGYKEIAKTTVLHGKAKNWTPPILANGAIYCRNSDGTLVCVDVK